MLLPRVSEQTSSASRATKVNDVLANWQGKHFFVRCRVAMRALVRPERLRGKAVGAASNAMRLRLCGQPVEIGALMVSRSNGVAVRSARLRTRAALTKPIEISIPPSRRCKAIASSHRQTPIKLPQPVFSGASMACCIPSGSDSAHWRYCVSCLLERCASRPFDSLPLIPNNVRLRPPSPRCRPSEVYK